MGPAIRRRGEVRPDCGLNHSPAWGETDPGEDFRSDVAQITLRPEESGKIAVVSVI